MNLVTAFVRAGQKLTIGPWNALAAAVRSIQLIKGPGVFLRSTPEGTVISFEPPPIAFLHAFKITLIGLQGASLRPGVINGVMPTIDGDPLEPVKATDEPPRLEWTSPNLDDKGYGWIAVEVTLGEKWEVISAEIVQVANLDTDDGDVPTSAATQPVGYTGGGTLTLSGRRARHPLGMLRKRSTGELVCFQITKFDLKHRVALAGPTATTGRHFFSPA